MSERRCAIEGCRLMVWAPRSVFCTPHRVARRRAMQAAYRLANRALVHERRTRLTVKAQLDALHAARMRQRHRTRWNPQARPPT